MKRHVFSLAFVVLLFVASSPAFAALVFDAGSNMLANEIAGATNPNGAWSYGFRSTTTGALTLFTNQEINVDFKGWHDTNSQCCGPLPHVLVNTGLPQGNPQGTIATGEISMHPDGNPAGGFAGEEKAVVRFTAPLTGKYTIKAFFEDVNDCCGTNNNASPGVDVHVVLNAASIFDSAISREIAPFDPANLPTLASYNGLIAMNAGDTLDFVVGTNGQLFGDETRFNAIVSVPEPTTIAIWSLLGLVGSGFAWRKARKGASRA